MRLGRSRPLVSIAVLAVLALGAGACSSSPSNSHSGASGSAVPASAAADTVKVASAPTFGNVLVNSAGMALYTYGPDRGHNGMSNCSGSCAQAWPPLTVPAGTAPTRGTGVTGTLSAVKQANGTYQVTYDGLPLYTFVQDSAPDQVTGNNVAGFSVAKPASSGSSTATSSSATTSTTSGRY
jgi:predicted lipoprotein with Yx(FWY)xxD motif